MVVKVDEAGKHVVGFLKGSGLVSIDAFRFENGEEILCYSVAVTATPP